MTKQQINNAAIIQITKWRAAIDRNDVAAIDRYARRSFRMASLQMQQAGMRCEYKEPEALAAMHTMNGNI